MIAEFAALIPESILDKSGAVFYSGRAAFSAPSRLYILGSNPGGSPEEMPDATVKKHTQMVLGERRENWSAYRDEKWHDEYKKGEYGIQPQVLYLLGELKLDPGLIPASNVVFVRSSQTKDIEHDFRKYAECCWRFHEAVIERLHVRAILCLGWDAGNWVLDKYGLQNTKPCNTFVEKNKRHWTNSSYISPSGIGIVIVNHPSRVDWKNPNTDPSPLVRNMLNS